MGYVIDSNAVIDYLSGQLPEKGMLFMNDVINGIPSISVMTQIEVLGFSNSAQVEALLNQFIEFSIVEPLNNEIIQTTISLRKQNKIKTPDAIIAATAMVLNYSLVTRNTSDFKKLGALDIIDPWTI